MARLAGLLVGLSLCACAARYQLLDPELEEARRQGVLGTLRVYPSNRTVSIYDEPDSGSVTVSREIRQTSTRDQERRILGLNTSGVIVAEDTLGGVPLLWVSFDRQCAQAGCAYGFVQTEDGRYRLVHVPEREGFAPPKVYRGCTLKRHRMKRGNLHALSEANAVYRLKKRSGRALTVFLEVKKEIRRRVRRGIDRESGV